MIAMGMKLASACFSSSSTSSSSSASSTASSLSSFVPTSPSSGSGVLAAMVVVMVVVLMMMVGGASAETTDFSNPIRCYTCRGPAVNSTCSDPVDTRDNKHLGQKDCIKGVCLKWAKYEEGVLQMIRTCSADLNFYLTMIDGVCRTERNGNGYLCMCGKHLCNHAAVPRPSLATCIWGLAILLAAYSVIVQRRL